jgi:hypothetical protein
MEFWNSFNVCNDNNNLLIKEIKSVGGSVGGILAIYKYVSASKCLRVSNEFISTNTLSVFIGKIILLNRITSSPSYYFAKLFK